MTLGFWEILVVAVALLLVAGPDKLPDALKTIARALARLRRAAEEVRGEIDDICRESMEADGAPGSDADPGVPEDAADSSPPEIKG